MKIKHHIASLREILFSGKQDTQKALGASYYIFLELEDKIMELENRIQALEKK
jgi:hypothetical protein